MIIRRRLTGAFRYRDYRLLWLLTMTGSIAVWMRILGSAQWLLEETGSAAMVGVIGVVQLVIQIQIFLDHSHYRCTARKQQLCHDLVAMGIFHLGSPFLRLVGRTHFQQEIWNRTRT